MTTEKNDALSLKAIEMLGNSALMGLMNEYVTHMGNRNYEKALNTMARMLLVTSSLVLLKDATFPPAMDEIVLRALTSLQGEVDFLAAVFSTGMEASDDECD